MKFVATKTAARPAGITPGARAPGQSAHRHHQPDLRKFAWLHVLDLLASSCAPAIQCQTVIFTAHLFGSPEKDIRCPETAAFKMNAESSIRLDSDLSDIELVDQVIRGARGAFERFYRRHNRLIFHCIRARADAADANDLFQGFFERLVGRDYHVLKLWHRSASLPIYLSMVVRNFVLDFHRAQRKKKEQGVGGLTELEPISPSEDETVTTGLILKQLRKKGIEAWIKLDPRDRILMCGKFHRDTSNEVLAERLELSAGALRTALSRAQAKLLERLQELAPEYFPARV